jgi:predicted pyridoxine 5'-phosphate oxidase superfamily flavin-nucleotide-binding protein
MSLLTGEMRRMIQTTGLCFAATVGEDGAPNLSPKASLAVIDDEHIGFADCMSPQTVANVRHNPAMEINVVDIFLRRGYRFKGTAEVIDEGPDFDAVANAFWAKAGDAYPVNHVVRMKVESARPVNSPIYIYEPELSEDEIRDRYLGVYTRIATGG